MIKTPLIEESLYSRISVIYAPLIALILALYISPLVELWELERVILVSGAHASGIFELFSKILSSGCWLYVYT